MAKQGLMAIYACGVGRWAGFEVLSRAHNFAVVRRCGGWIFYRVEELNVCRGTPRTHFSQSRRMVGDGGVQVDGYVCRLIVLMFICPHGVERPYWRGGGGWLQRWLQRCTTRVRKQGL